MNGSTYHFCRHEIKLHWHFCIKLRGRRRTRNKLFLEQLNTNTTLQTRWPGSSGTAQTGVTTRGYITHTHPSAFPGGRVETRDNTCRCFQTETRHGHGSIHEHTHTHTYTQDVPPHTLTQRHTRLRGRRAPRCRLRARMSFGSPRGPPALPV